MNIFTEVGGSNRLSWIFQDAFLIGFHKVTNINSRGAVPYVFFTHIEVFLCYSKFDTLLTSWLKQLMLSTYCLSLRNNLELIQDNPIMHYSFHWQAFNCTVKEESSEVWLQAEQGPSLIGITTAQWNPFGSLEEDVTLVGSLPTCSRGILFLAVQVRKAPR